MSHLKTMLVALLAAAPASGQAGEPSPAARALASALAPQRLYLIDMGPETMREHVEQELLYVHHLPSGPGCERALPACQAAARRIAADVAPTLLAEYRAAVERAYAAQFDATMTAAEMEAARRFLETEAGQKLLSGLNLLTSVPREASMMEAALTNVAPAMRPLRDLSEARRRFLEETRDLPRAPPLPPMVAPPPPPPPPRLPPGR